MTGGLILLKLFYNHRRSVPSSPVQRDGALTFAHLLQLRVQRVEGPLAAALRGKVHEPRKAVRHRPPRPAGEDPGRRPPEPPPLAGGLPPGRDGGREGGVPGPTEDAGAEGPVALEGGEVDPPRLERGEDLADLGLHLGLPDLRLEGR